MDKNRYYHCLKRMNIDPRNAELIQDNTILAYIESVVERGPDIYEVNNKVRVSGARFHMIAHERYNYEIYIADHTSFISLEPRYRVRDTSKYRGRKSTGRIPLSVQPINNWIGKLIMDKKINLFDEFDIDTSRKQVLVQGAVLKYISHSTPLEDVLWRPGINRINGLLVCVSGMLEGGMSKDELALVLNVNRTGDRSDWWYIYQISLMKECVDVLEEAPWRTLVEYRENDILLTIPVSYPNTSSQVRSPGSRVWDPF